MKFRKRTAAAIAVSAAAHFMVVHPDSTTPFRRAAAYIADQYEEYAIRKAREELVGQAIADLRNGNLKLGEFILKSTVIDYREEGKEFDYENALERYNGYVEKMPAPYSSPEKRVQKAVPKVFRDMSYYGVPGGRMGDALLEGGGSCDQLSVLIASVVYDAGYTEQSFLRRYGPGEDGVGHMAPIFLQDRVEYDLTAGKESDRKGTRFPAENLVFAYAAKHGLVKMEYDTPPGKKSGTGSSQGGGTCGAKRDPNLPEGKPTGFEFPPAKDSFEGGSTPLYSSHGVGEFRPQARGSIGRPQVIRGWNWEPQDFLNPAFLGNPPLNSRKSPVMKVTAVKSPEDRELERLSKMIEHTRKELREAEKDEKKVLLLGALVGLYSKMMFDSALAGNAKVAGLAEKESDRMLEKGQKLLADIQEKGEWKLADPWQLVFLGPAAHELLFSWIEGNFERFEEAFAEDALPFLVANHSTRERAVALLEKLSIGEQVDVFFKLRGTEFEGYGEVHRAYAAYSYLRDMDFQSNRVGVEGILNKGESIPFGEYHVKFEGLEGAGRSRTGAVIAIQTKDKEVLEKFKLLKGQSVNSRAIGPDLTIKIKDMAPGYAFGANWADISVSVSKPDFSMIANEVRQTCAILNLGKRWEDYLIANMMISTYGELHRGTGPGAEFNARRRDASRIFHGFERWFSENESADLRRYRSLVENIRDFEDEDFRAAFPNMAYSDFSTLIHRYRKAVEDNPDNPPDMIQWFKDNYTARPRGGGASPKWQSGKMR